MDACKSGLLDAEVCVVLSNNPNAQALDRARMANIPVEVVDPNDDSETLHQIMKHGADFVVLAGYFKKIGFRVIEKFDGRIINIHPSLLPKYGGKGMYGLAVHQRVIDNNDGETGITIHHVTREYDQGEIIEQLKISVLEGETAENLAERILKYEPILLVHTIKRMLENG